MTKKLKWRLSKLPTPEEVRNLVNDKIITQEEARQIFFEEVDKRDEKSLKEEIKFLRKLVDKLSQNNYTKVIEVIREESIKPYTPWFTPYYTWSSSDNITLCSGSTGGSLNFSDIVTF